MGIFAFSTEREGMWNGQNGFMEHDGDLYLKVKMWLLKRCQINLPW